jgi:LPS sulfotransferase NodH
MEAYAHLFLNRRPENVRVLLFAQGRTGTTLLEELLCSTGHLVRHGEILRKRGKYIRFPIAYVKGRARCVGKRNFICHVKPSHLRFIAGSRPADLKGFLQALTDDGFRIISLTRSDRLGQFLSMRMGEARGNFHKRDDSPETTRLVIDRKQLQEWVEKRQSRDKEESAALEGFDVIRVEYGADLENSELHQATIDRILDSLSLPRRPVRTSLRKINRRPVWDIVENYHEFATWAEELGVADSLPPAGEMPRQEQPRKREKVRLKS